jgi:hypothetical protein
MTESIGISNCAGLAIQLHTENPPGQTAPDRLTIEIRIPFDLIRQLPPPQEADGHDRQ